MEKRISSLFNNIVYLLPVTCSVAMYSRQQTGEPRYGECAVCSFVNGRNLLPIGAKIDPFSEGAWVTIKYSGSHKIVSLVNMAENLSCRSSPILPKLIIHVADMCCKEPSIRNLSVPNKEHTDAGSVLLLSLFINRRCKPTAFARISVMLTFWKHAPTKLSGTICLKEFETLFKIHRVYSTDR